MKVNDLMVMETVYNQQHGISDIMANLRFPQKYITLEYNGELYNLDIVSTDDYEFIVKITDNVNGGRK